MREIQVSERGVAGMAAVLVLLLWVVASMAMTGCQTAPPVELRSASVSGYVLIESGGVITRVDLGTGVVMSDSDVPTRLVAAALHVDADIGAAQVGVDVERADGGPHVIVIRWGAMSWRFELGDKQALQ
jgi:hypothetical protein